MIASISRSIMKNFPPIFATLKAQLQTLGAWILRSKRNRRISAQILALIPTGLWLAIHSPISNGISFFSLIFTVPLAYFVFSMLYGAVLTTFKRTLIHTKRSANVSQLFKRLAKKNNLFIMVTLAIPMLLILSLLFIDRKSVV